MNVALLGYGKMGHEIETILLDQQHEIGLRIDSRNRNSLNKEKLASCDVAIEFSTPESAVENLMLCLAADVPVVSGTTGWLNQWDSVIKAFKEQGGGLFYAPNFSIGVNLFFKAVSQVSALMQGFDYQPSIEEIHHKEKKDAPSGTAIRTAEYMLKEYKQLSGWVLTPEREEQALPITAKREEGVPGTHSVLFKGEEDEIEIKHTAFSRKGFARGAVMAARFMVGKEGIYNMDDLLHL